MSDPAVVGISSEQFEELLKRVGTHSATAMQKALVPEDNNPPKNSVFHPLGVDKPHLTRPTYFCYVKQNEDQLTPGEIADFNAIEKDCHTRDGSWWARIQRNGSQEELLIWVPSKTIDARMDLPNPRRGSPLTGLQMICRELRQSDE